MNNDNRVSATLDDGAVGAVIAKVQEIRASMTFLLTLSMQDRKELPKMGDKSIGFDDKCVAYMGSNPEFLPGFIDLAEVRKDRALRTQMMRVYAELATLTEAVDDTLRVVASEVWMADLAYYQAVREAARRGRPGSQPIYEDLRQRFPGTTRTPAATAVGAAAKEPA